MLRVCERSGTGFSGISTEPSLGPDFFRRLLDNLNDGVLFADRSRRLLYWNKGAEAISGYRADEMVGKKCYASIFEHADGLGCHLCQGRCPLAEALGSGYDFNDRLYLRHKSGRRLAVDLQAIPIRDSDNVVVGAVEIFRDASTTVALELAYGHLRTLVEKDALTGVANRRHLDALITEQISVASRTGLSFCVIMADLDHFKRVNDTWGHGAGDQLLVAFAHALRTVSRTTDVVGRFGGEEFVVVLPSARITDALEVAERMRVATRTAGPAMCRTTASFGVTEAVSEDSYQTLMRRADAALYAAKRNGRDRVELAIAGTAERCALAMP